MRRLLAIFALVPLAAACGTSDTLSVDPVAKAAENTTHVSTMHIAMHARITVPGVARPIRMTASGGFQNEQKRGSLLLDMSDFAKAAPDPKLADPRLWRGAEVFDFSQRPIIYMHFPFLTRAVPGAKPWLRIDLQLIGEAMGMDLGGLMQGSQGNPAQQLDYLRAVSGNLKELGTEQVRGISTRHYRATVDLRKYEKLAPEGQQESAKQTIDQLVKITGVSSYPVDVWVDSKQFVRRMSFEMTMKTAGSETSMAMTIDSFGFGEPVKVQFPPKSQTMDFRDFIRKAG